MIITDLKGGLGNQMFQYAAGLALSLEKNTEHKVRIAHFKTYGGINPETPRELRLTAFNVDLDIASEEEIKHVRFPYPVISHILSLANFYLLVHDYIKYPIVLNKNSKDIYLDGHFPSEDYFKKFADVIHKEFTLKEELQTKEFNDFCSKIAKDGEKSVSVHIRRGDYVTNAYASKHHGVLEVDYYERAINLLKEKYGNLKPYVFTEFKEDIEWVKKNMPFLGDDVTYMKDYDFDSAQSMIIMSKCKNNIIANSSFSWWGAWLNQNNDKIVIAPKSWLKNGDGRNKRIVPEDWTRI